MKKIVLFLLLIGVVFTSCVKSLDKEGVFSTTEYTGKVLEGSQHEPIPEVKVILSDGIIDTFLTMTDQHGSFSVMIDVDERQDADYLELLYEPIGKSVKLDLVGLGEKAHDFGDIILYDALEQLPKVSTDTVVEIGNDYVVLSGELLNEGDSAVIAVGFCVDTIINPSFPDSSRFSMDKTKLGKYIDTITELIPGMHYYYRAYAKNVYGIVYGDCKDFYTLGGSPVVVTDSVCWTPTNVRCYGHLQVDGGVKIDSCGFLCIFSSDIRDEGTMYSMPYTNEFFEMDLCVPDNVPSIYIRAFVKCNECNEEVYYGDFIICTNPNAPFGVQTGSIVLRKAHSVIASGILNMGGYTDIVCGLLWNTDETELTLEQAMDTTKIQGYEGEFTSIATHLTAATTYYIRTYAYRDPFDSEKVKYGEPMEVTTRDGVVDAVTLEVTDVTNTTAKSGVLLQDDGGLDIFSGGICWSQNADFTIENCEGKVEVVSTLEVGNNVSLQMTDLQSNKNYYVKAYCETEDDVQYGNLEQFSTVNDALEIHTGDPSTFIVKAYSIIGKGSVFASVIEGVRCGLLWDTDYNHMTLEQALGHQDLPAVNGGEFSIKAERLQPNTKYYFKAYAYRDQSQVEYATMVDVTTDDGIANVVTLTVTDVESHSAVSGVRLQDDGGLEIYSGGICWSKNELFDFENCDGHSVANQIVLGVDSPTTMNGLDRYTEYWVKAYCLTKDGDFVYGQSMPFLTSPDSPSLENVLILPNFITDTTAHSYCSIKDDGGVDITKCGVFWSTDVLELNGFNPNCPHTEDIFNGTSFESDLTGLLPNTHYYVKAYAFNSAEKFAESNVIEFDTKKGKPVVRTLENEVEDSNNVVLYGEIVNDGGCSLIEKGFCYGTSSNPTIEGEGSSVISEDDDNELFHSSITLRPGIYHYRAYAKNELGISYGDDKIFTVSQNNSNQ